MALDAVFQFFVRRQRYIGAIPIDMVERETYQHQAVVTSNPTEVGSNVDDHVYIEPLRIQLSGQVSDAAFNIIDALVGLSQRHIEAYQQLEELFKSRQAMTITLGFSSYDNMVLTGFNVVRDPSTGQRLRFDCELQQIIAGTTFTVQFNNDNTAPEFNDLAGSRRELGRVTPTEIAQ